MLAQLTIENLAVIQHAELRFGEGFHVFTGETGAGKSMVIDAINAVLGQRTSREIVRHGCRKAVVTAVFSDLDAETTKLLTQAGYPPEEDGLIILREIGADGKSSARMMGRPIPVGQLRELGAALINIHGQHDNQILLSPERHLEILDGYGGYSDLQEKYYADYRRVVEIKRALKRLSMDEQEKERRIDLLSFQVKEIEEAGIKPGEDALLERQCTAGKNAARITAQLAAAYRALSGDEEGEGSALELVRLAAEAVNKAAGYDETQASLAARLEDLAAELEDTADALSRGMDAVGFRPEELEEMQNRLDELRQLKRKYGDTLEDVLAYAEKSKTELESLESAAERLQELSVEGNAAYADLLRSADVLTRARKAAADRFIRAVTEELRFLDMPRICLEADFQKVRPNSKGQDELQFLVSANPGEPPKPLSKIASGGELSRMMLAIKNVMADSDRIPTLIFDEIDTGVSGHAAQKIGQKLKQAAGNRQILAVTHLAQIAALADRHYLIRKDTRDDETFTDVSLLAGEERVHEVARIMSTDRITPSMLQTAREMIEEGK